MNEAANGELQRLQKLVRGIPKATKGWIGNPRLYLWDKDPKKRRRQKYIGSLVNAFGDYGPDSLCEALRIATFENFPKFAWRILFLAIRGDFVGIFLDGPFMESDRVRTQIEDLSLAHPKGFLRGMAAEALSRYEVELSVLERWSWDTEPRVRYEAGWRCGNRIRTANRKEREMLKTILIRLSRDPSPGAREGVSSMLTEIWNGLSSKQRQLNWNRVQFGFARKTLVTKGFASFEEVQWSGLPEFSKASLKEDAASMRAWKRIASKAKRTYSNPGLEPAS